MRAALDDALSTFARPLRRVLARGPLRRAVVGSCIEKAATSLPRRSAANARERVVFGIVVCVFSRARLQKNVRVG